MEIKVTTNPITKEPITREDIQTKTMELTEIKVAMLIQQDEQVLEKDAWRAVVLPVLQPFAAVAFAIC